MTTLFISEPGATLREEQGNLLVTAPKSHEVLAEVVPSRLEAVALFGSVHMTQPALSTLLKARVGVAWLSHDGELLGALEPPLPKSGQLRLAQAKAALDPASRLALARAFVHSKLAAAISELEAARSKAAGAAAAQIKALESKLEDQASIEELHGFEGNAARIYFEGYAATFTADLPFPGRRKRPPPDPVNAMLSLGYTLLCNRLASLIRVRGLDPDIGFLHETQDGRSSLALDLLETFRAPLVDHCVRRLVNLRICRPQHFESSENGGMRFTRDGLRIFLRAWEDFLAEPAHVGGKPRKAALQHQVDRWAMYFREGRSYEPTNLL